MTSGVSCEKPESRFTLVYTDNKAFVGVRGLVLVLTDSYEFRADLVEGLNIFKNRARTYLKNSRRRHPQQVRSADNDEVCES